MILIGIDDTDLPDTAGTNQLARQIARALPAEFHCDVVLRHQLLLDPRIPYTSHNGSASLGLHGPHPRHNQGLETAGLQTLIGTVREAVLDFSPPGSDPGLCVAVLSGSPPPELLRFGRLCKEEPVGQDDARRLAGDLGLRLEGLGGTQQGVVGALAAVSLRASGDDGRVVHAQGWPWPDHFGGVRTVEEILARGVDEIRVLATGEPVHDPVDLGKRLRPSFRNHRIVLWVERHSTGPAPWSALKLP